ncbi:MAG: trimethylamine methyltransferase family protein [Planctomycetota bacterium]
MNSQSGCLSEDAGRVGGYYRPLRADLVGRIHQTSLRVLEEIGLQVDSDFVRDRMTEVGGWIDSRTGRLRISSERLEELVWNCPSRVDLYGRKDQHLRLEDDRTYLGTGGAATQVLDLESGEVRPSETRDIARFATLAEELSGIGFFVRLFYDSEATEVYTAANEFYASLAHTTKHVMGGVYDPEGVDHVAEMGRIIAGSDEEFRSHPCLSIITNLVRSPLTFDSDGARIVERAVERGIPVTLSCAPMAGSTSPLTLSGTLAQLHAEELAGILYTQAVEPGAPVIYGGIPSIAEMHRLRYMGGAVEFGMMNAAISQLSHYINVPNYNSAGITEAKRPDIQAVYEKCFSILQCALSGSNCIHHAAGMLESLLTVSAEQMVIDHEIINMALRALHGIDVDEDHLAFEAIEQAVEEGGYVTLDHTVRHMREEYVEPLLADRQNREEWRESGMKWISEKARERARNILSQSEETPECLPAEADKQIRDAFDICI